MDGFVQIDGDLLLKQAALFEDIERENAELLAALKFLMTFATKADSAGVQRARVAVRNAEQRRNRK